ncbi:MAG: hypothetical protein RPU61_03565 [Candidatus Sedimenticola sp. (ex Thyasira tokunagai)]
MSDVRLETNGIKYGGWKAIRIQRGIEQISGQFELSLTEKWAEQNTPRPIRPGAACRISIDGETVITGHVDDVDPQYSSKSHSITAKGRDATADLVDCSAPSFQWKGQTLLQGAEKLCRPFGIRVQAATDVGAAFTFKNNEGETVFETIERPARIRGLLLISDGQGGLLITRAGTKRAAGRLVLGKNIKEAKGHFSHRNRFSSYTIKGQSNGNAFSEAAQAYQVMAEVTDQAIKRHRPMIIVEDDPIDAAAAKTRTTWQRNVNAGRSQSVTYTVQGWRDQGGALWSPNWLIPVDDGYMGISREMLITTVALILDDQGERAELTVMLPEAFDLIELPEPKEDEGGFGA